MVPGVYAGDWVFHCKPSFTFAPSGDYMAMAQKPIPGEHPNPRYRLKLNSPTNQNGSQNGFDNHSHSPRAATRSPEAPEEGVRCVGALRVPGHAADLRAGRPRVFVSRGMRLLLDTPVAMEPKRGR